MLSATASIPKKSAIGWLMLLLASVMLAAIACGGQATPLPTATPSPAVTPSPTATGVSSPTTPPTLEPTATATPSPTPGPTATPAPTQSPSPSPAPALPTPTPSGNTYTVQPGDTLFSIARRFGTTVEAMVAANGLTDPSQIRVGQVLVIPGGGPIVTPTPGSGAAEVIRKVSTSRKMVAFSFDAGADPGFTSKILDTLKANGITASFGMTGRWAEQNPDLVRRIAREGHHFINHSYDHPSFTGLSTDKPPLARAQRWEQLDRTEAIVQNLTGVSTKPYFRPPFGDYDASVNADIAARGYRYNVMWTVDSRGWQGISASAITERCLSLAEPGAVYVFHVGSASQDAAALPAIIQGLREKGYSFGSVPQLLAQ